MNCSDCTILTTSDPPPPPLSPPSLLPLPIPTLSHSSIPKRNSWKPNIPALEFSRLLKVFGIKADLIARLEDDEKANLYHYRFLP